MLSTFICMNSKTMSWFGKVEKAKDVSSNKLAKLPLFVLIFFFLFGCTFCYHFSSAALKVKGQQQAVMS